MSGDVPAVSLSIRIVERLAGQWPAGVPTAVLVRELGMNRSTCYNILSTLLDSEWVGKLDGRSGWTIGPRMFALARLNRNHNFVEVQATLESLSHELGLVVFIAQKSNGGEYVVIARADRGFGVRVTAEVGDTFPFGAPALMQSFEAWTQQERLRELVRQHGLTRFTDYSVASFGELTEILAEVRKSGFSYSIQRFDLAQSGVAAPIFDARSQPTRVLCTLGFFTDLNEHNVIETGVRLRGVAQEITRLLGGTLPATLMGAAHLLPNSNASRRRPSACRPSSAGTGPARSQRKR